MSRFFIDRPIFAWVIAIIVMLAGVVAIVRMPVAQYPAIAAPAITVTARRATAQGAGRRGTDHGRALADARGDDHRVPAAADPRAGRGRRVPARAGGSRRCRARRADAGARRADRARRGRSHAREGPARRARGSPAVQARRHEDKAAAFGLALADVNDSISSTWGAAYVNDFLDRGRTKRVFMQADAPYRMQPSDLARWYVRTATNTMVPFSAFAHGTWRTGSPRLERFNGFPAVSIQGEPAPGKSSGEALREVARLASQLPHGFGYDWYGPAYEELRAGTGILTLYALSLLVVFLCLAALYESLSIPAAVLLVVPIGALGAAAGSLLGKQAKDVYFQVGILAVIGLAAKNAILIVEFARTMTEQGTPAREAAVAAARLRLRPILMTSLALVLGVLPLAISRGAGSGAQNAIGIAIVDGVLTATFLGVLLVPVFFVVISGRRRSTESVAA
jgi:multidrug efflux pump subunit AcrB